MLDSYLQLGSVSLSDWLGERLLPSSQDLQPKASIDVKVQQLTFQTQ